MGECEKVLELKAQICMLEEHKPPDKYWYDLFWIKERRLREVEAQVRELKRAGEQKDANENDINENLRERVTELEKELCRRALRRRADAVW